MIVKRIELDNFRNYELLKLDLDGKTNILYGNNAQGKTNILESVYVCSTTKSHRTNKDSELINLNADESHIKLILEKNKREQRIDIHLRRNKTKGIAINGIPIKKASELFGLFNVVIFSPEDLSIIKNGPAERRKFMDIELCQLDKIYVYNLTNYNKVVTQRNRLLENRKKDIKVKSTSVGPHKDDILFFDLNDENKNIRVYGSQGQQRTVALSLKLAEIELVKSLINDTPVLLLDDVLSELDSTRQNHLLKSLDDIQTIITCTGLDDFIENRFKINKIFQVKNGKVEEKTV